MRKSVANNLNDISKDHPGLTLDVCERWLGHSERTDWIVKHACRTLLKAGNTRALRFFGFGDPAHIRVADLALYHEDLRIGEELRFSFGLVIDSDESCRVRIEYAIHYVRARDRRSIKIFQIAESTYAPGSHAIARRRSFADLSTRKHYPGTHELAIIVNGVEKARAVFELEEPTE